MTDTQPDGTFSSHQQASDEEFPMMSINANHDPDRASTASADSKGGSSGNMFLALAPWILFTVVAEHGTLKIASVLALVAAIAIAGRSIAAGSPKLLELGAVVSFVVFAVLAFAADPSVGAWLERYARGIAAGGLALIAFISVVTVPFTEQYARDSVPEKFWNTPTFKETNRKLSLMWALIFTAMIPGHVVAGIVDTKPTNILLNWAVPIGLVIFGMKKTQEITEDKHTSVAAGIN
jgi:hypothetical protein